ncbi:type II secretion system GspH family protein [Shewanella mesophila]|uniref:prepilin-type N-terminal cleavage/methylation domain-containing protein n=1 Tax=Shewanella mesophila TaxID=2864208 RepID=UPI001C657723|nr:prepilin-type N-terminal cleavage/methylation domain-containing protein [Shewanella mesophila]QYJ85003.1 type II secretion system GspH family protein [Shewanella mesophila]
MVKQQGMTLLEMLIAMLIMSSVMMLSSSAYSYYIAGFQNKQKQVEKSLDLLFKESRWQEQLTSAFYYLYKSPNGRFVPFFKGNHTDIFWVSRTGLSQQDQAAQSWLGILDGQFTYCEQSLSVDLVQSGVFDAEALCENFKLPLYPAEAIKITYFGYKSRMDKYNAMSEFLPLASRPQPSWSETYQGKELELLPDWVKIQIFEDRNAKENLEYWSNILDNDPNKLRYFTGALDA